jgi:hypothetical protein
LPGKLVENINSTEDLKFARCHPAIFEKVNSNKIKSGYNWADIVYKDLAFLSNHYHKILILHPSLTTKLWIENNVLQKCSITLDFFNKWYKPAGYSETFLSELLTSDLVEKLRIIVDKEVKQENLSQWGKSKAQDIEIWELREILSLYWFTREKDIFTCWTQLSQQFPNIKFLSMESLKNNTHSSIVECLNYFELNEYSQSKLNNIINEWQKMQIHIDKDRDIGIIINSIINNIDYNWNHVTLTLLDEAYIQKTLRDFGVEIRCYKLDKLPKNTRDFFCILEK